VGRRRKNAGLDRPASLEKSERWLREALSVPAPADAEDGDDAAFASDVELLQVLFAQVASESPHFWKAWRTLGARRAIGTFEQGAAVREKIAKTTARSVSPAAQRVASLLAELEGHLVVFVVEDAEIASHLGRVVRVGQTGAHWDAGRLERERERDQSFQARASRSRRVLVEEGRRHLELAQRAARLAGLAPSAGDAEVDRLVAALVANTNALTTHLGGESPRGDRTQRAQALAAAMKRWCAERTLPEPAHESLAGVLSRRWTERLVSELDALRSASAEVVYAHEADAGANIVAPAGELLTRTRHVQIDLGGAVYLTPARTLRVSSTARAFANEYARERRAIAPAWGTAATRVLDELAASLPGWCEELAAELVPQGTHPAAGRKPSPALGEQVIAMLGGHGGFHYEEMIEILKYGSAPEGDVEGHVRQLRDAGRAMLRRRRRQGLEPAGRRGRPRGRGPVQ
jgi:hypothetical protein